MRKSFSTNRAFTLIELLTVIAIIGVLVALLFPAIKNAMLKAEQSKAQAAISGLATAFKSYYTEYGRWPIAYAGAPPVAYEDFVVDKAMVALLSGDDVGGPTSIISIVPPKATKDTPPPGGSYSASLATIQRNPRKTVFLEFKTKDLDGSAATLGYFLDPWGRHYHFRLDVNYLNQVDYPFALAGFPLTGVGFLIWSVGPDGQYIQGDVVFVGPPFVVQTQSPLNKDNVKSW